jgi:YgiT-type zinc finger domain-containing protein
VIRCSNCARGSMVAGRTKSHDIGPLLGLDEVLLEGAPALVCNNCEHVMLEGEVVEGARHEVARLIVQDGAPLAAAEVRFLRETLDMTQAQLAERLDITRVTVTRWEAGEELGPVQSFALRTLASWALDGERLAKAVSSPNAPKRPRSARPLRVAGATLRGAA